VLYVDTSVIVKLYIKEKYSLKVSNWIRKNNEPIPLTRLHELEFINAVHLKQFRQEINIDRVGLLLSRFEEHQRRGIFFRPSVNWADTLDIAVELSKQHTTAIGSRSLDILHVAFALSIKTDRFLTLDQRQSKLASSAGLTIENFR